MKKKKRFLALLPLILTLASAAPLLRAQVVPAAFKPAFSLTAGGIGSVFYPDWISNKLIGVGAYVDLNLYHGIGVEAEGRWQRFHELDGISQDNYLIGPRVKIHHLWRFTPYGKGLVGFSNMNFGGGQGTGRFTTIAFGGGLDLQVNRRWSVRALDGEYQYWPSFLGGTLKPYGASVGVGYRIF